MPVTSGASSISNVAVELDSRKINAIFAPLDSSHLPGVAVGIAIGGRPVYRKGFGLASMELPQMLSPGMRMRVGSITKHFTAFAYLLLCEDGKAGIDDPIGKYLPEVHPVTRDLTMRRLMGNTGGHRDVHDICWQFSGTRRPVSSAELLSVYKDISDVNAPAGSTWIYNNGGWLMLSSAIERITERPLEQVLRERIFEPVGMFDTMLRRSDSGFVSNSATLHMTSTPGCFEKGYLGTELAGEGGVVSTINDMLRWLAHIDAPVIGKTETWVVMKSPQMLTNGTSTGYGLGLMTGRYRGVEILYHTGGVIGGNAQMLKVPSAGLDVAIMVNRHDVSGMLLVNRILDACLPGLKPPKKGCQRPRASGIFRSATTGRVIRLHTSSTFPWVKLPWSTHRKQVVSIDGMDMPVEPDDNGVLWPVGIFGNVKQGLTLLGDPGKPTSIRFTDFGNSDELPLVNPIEEPDVRAIAGHYQSESTQTEATICESNEGPRLHTVGRFGSVVYELIFLADRIWQAKHATALPWGGILSFEDEGGGFRFSTYQTRSLPFRRTM